MSNVPLGKRDKRENEDGSAKDPFLASHHLKILRKEITDLMLLDFGFDKSRRDKEIERYAQRFSYLENADEVVERYRKKAEAFQYWFIDHECNKVIEIMQRIVQEFEWGNSIFPTQGPALLMEYCERRKHLTDAAGLCNVLKQEIQYIAETLPVDKNKYDRFSEACEYQISLIKGVRQAGNKFLKAKGHGTGKKAGKSGMRPGGTAAGG